ncbi:MAG: glucose-6-phosphate isomerase [Desulfobacterales bacterium]|nr:glucose-6-phosphate isomerase [Desulfobacterales bacterium]
MGKLTDLSVWHSLKQESIVMNRLENHLKVLGSQPNRINQFSRKGAGLFYDFSRQRVNEQAMELLFELANVRHVQQQFERMVKGEIVNSTENRAALHTATRNYTNEPIWVNQTNVMPEIEKIRNEIKEFSEKIHQGIIRGSTGKRFKDIIVIGIGGSYLGPEFVAQALSYYADQGMNLYFISNVDYHNFVSVVSNIDPEAALWVVISKSYTTVETLSNTQAAYAFMKEKGLDPAKHVVTVTSKGSPGDCAENPVIQTFHMFDYIGGRYSVTSAVGAVPLSLYVGYDRFERFLKGANEVDQHAQYAPLSENIPLISALISIWNNNFLGYEAQAIIPYASPLCKLAPHVQQLYMESNGKCATLTGHQTTESTGVIIFGEPGTNAQHSFFQLIHQGRTIPVEFIGVVKPQYGKQPKSEASVSNHEELWANMIAQASALANGKESQDMARKFSGNRPSSTLIIDDLSPENVGRLLAFYEARTVFEAFIWDTNPFDQFGVELGKKLADSIRKEMTKKNADSSYSFDTQDNITKYYLNLLYKG